MTPARSAHQEQIAPDTPVTQERVPALDGLRGIAILLVMMIHFAQVNPRSYHWVNDILDAFLRVGWIGVDLFFVLSGFLITGILCDARARPHYFRNFYMRRTLRIFPLYYASLVVLLVVLPGLAAPRPELQSAVESAGWYWTYLVNVRTAQVGWLDAPYVGHFWSLAVEEQFYLLWPLLVLRFDRRAMIRCSLGLIIGAIALRVFLHVGGAPTAAYVLTPARFDSLAIGGLVALLAREPGGLRRIAGATRVIGWVCGIGLTLIIASYGRLHPEDPMVGTLGYTLLAGMFASVLVSAVLASGSSREARFWRSRPLVFFGRYSYALYVIHPAVIYFWPSALSAERWWSITGFWFGAYLVASGLMTAACVGLALLSWHALEKHFLRLRFRFADARSTTASREAIIPSNARSATLPVRR